MSPGLVFALAGLGMQASPPPPPSAMLVHGYVYFGPGSDAPIRRSDVDPMDYLAPRIPPDAFVHVRGQADTVGSPAFNDDLSRRRARAVAALLVQKGVDPDRITLLSCGERRLNRPTADETPEPLNRFAEFDWTSRLVQASPSCPAEPYRR